MLRKWGGRCVSAARNPGACRALRRSPYSLLQYQDASGAVAPIGSRELHVGVLGLGAIGTIFFTRLGRLAGDSKAETELPVLKVDAFVKPEQLSSWVEKEKLQLSLQGQQGDEILEFEGNSDEVTGIQAPNVRVRTLENAATNCEENKLDVLLVAVKAYDSAGVVRDLREKNKHLLKDDALCVLLQNGLGEVPRDERSSLSDADDQWQFANGVTFVGGRVLEFGSVLTSGLDTGMTYLAPCTNVGVGANEGDSKVEMLAQVLLAAGIHCEVLDESKMQAMLWRKLIVNAAINPLASLLDAPNRCVAGSEGSRQCVSMVVQEALAVAEREQVTLSCTPEELVQDIFEVARNTGTNICSMLADLRRGSRTEIDAITGRIVAGGKRHGVATPTNELLLSLIKALENEGTRRYIKQNKGT